MSSDFLATTGICVGLLVASQYLRSTLTGLLAPGSLTLGLLLEAIATFELCAVCFEQGLYFQFYDMTVFNMSLFLICLWRCYTWRNVSTTPYTHFERWLDGNLRLDHFFLYVAAELAAGALVYQYFTKPIWSLSLSSHHTTKLHSFAETPCQALVHVHYLLGALIEGGFTFAIEISFYFLAQAQNVSVHLLHAARATIITVLVYIAFYTTGGFMNPVLATVLQFNCGGITIPQHLIVYWVGPTLGSLSAYYLIKWLSARPPPPPPSPANGAPAENRKDL